MEGEDLMQFQILLLGIMFIVVAVRLIIIENKFNEIKKLAQIGENLVVQIERSVHEKTKQD